MLFIKHTWLFIKSFLLQLKRKWLSLPLLFLSPVLLIGLVFTLLITFFTPDANAPLKIGLVDLDQSQETSLIVEMMTTSTELGPLLDIKTLTEAAATEAITSDDLHVYLTLPPNFASNLYEGKSVVLEVIGNEAYPRQSYLVNEIVVSITRLISAAQANILTINHYAKTLPIDYETRNDLLFDYFKDFLFYTLGKDKIIERTSLINHATASPLNYYGLAAWFIITMSWLFIFYHFLYSESTDRIKRRMTLYGVTDLQEITARLTVSLALGLSGSLLSFLSLAYVLGFEFLLEDYIRLAVIMLLHSIIFLLSLALTELIIPAPKIRLLIQILMTALLMMASGGIIPVIYFPLQLQATAAWLFSHEAFFWIQEIILNERYYMNSGLLLTYFVSGLILLITVSLWKERAKR